MASTMAAAAEESRFDTAKDRPTPSANPLTKKINKIIESRVENDKETLEALKALATFFPENTIQSRRNLRGDIERRSLAINEEFVHCCRQVAQQLDSIYQDVMAMNECCKDMNQRLQSTKTQTHELISQTTKLHNESQRLQMRQEVASAFLKTFQLEPEEIKALRGTREGALSADFFTALARVKEIHNNCKVLLRTNQQTAGLEIMESMALHMETAYERLYRWTLSECRLVNMDPPDISPLLVNAIENLQDRPVLFKYSLDEFATARRAAVVRAFIDALTRGGAGNNFRPIELHSHDPLRYVGDMLAWLHQTSATEKEHLEAFFKRCSSTSTGNLIDQSLGHILEGVCRPLKVRVEQVIVSEPGAVVLYKLTNLLKFYHHTIGQVLSTEDVALLKTLEEMYILGHKMFFNSLNCHATKLMEKVELPPGDLAPIEAVGKTLALLREVLTCHDSSMVSLDNKQKDYSQILACVIDPLIQMCTLSASNLTTGDMAAYLLNCLYLIQSMVSMFEFTDHRLEMLQAQMDAHLDTLISEQVAYILNGTSLNLLYNTILQYTPAQGQLSTIPGMDATSIKTATAKFDDYLGMPDSFLLPQSEMLLSTSLRQRLRQKSTEVLVAAYKVVYDGLSNPSSGYTNIHTLIPRTPHQVQQLL